MSLTEAAPRPARASVTNAFRSVLWAEWVKLRTVRGWVSALVLGAAAMFAFCYLVANGPSTGTIGIQTIVPTGPGGDGVADPYEFVHQPLTGNGTIIARVTSLTGVTSTTQANAQGTLSSSHAGL